MDRPHNRPRNQPHSRPQQGDAAPDFSLDSPSGRHALQDYRGRWVVLYFYPKDMTPGCTQEACDFRDLLPGLAHNAAVLGVSGDDVASHRQFTEAYGLNFPLLYDENHEVAKLYGAYGEKTLYGKKTLGITRSTFVIDPEGRIAEAMVGVKAEGHAAHVAQRLAELQAEPEHGGPEHGGAAPG